MPRASTSTDERLRALALSSAWSIIFENSTCYWCTLTMPLPVLTSLIPIRAMVYAQVSNPKPGLKPTSSVHPLANERKRVISISSTSMLQSSQAYYWRLGWSDLSPMRRTHTYDYSGLRIDGQIPGRILDVGDDSKLLNSEMSKDKGRDGKAFFAGNNVL
jgi:hypothetical protein